jgi:hypothetical protein
MNRFPNRAAAVFTLGLLAAGSGQANVLTNGGFETDNPSGCLTPPGWAQIGHTDCSIAYSAVQAGIPGFTVYEGQRFYSIGGPGINGFANVGDGLSQSFATIIGATYQVTYGYSSENVTGATTSTLRVQAGNAFNDHVMAPSGSGAFLRPWSTGQFDFVASGTSTTLSMTLVASTAGVIGNNDPLLDGLSVVMTAVPEPGSVALWLAGSALLLPILRRRQR